MTNTLHDPAKASLDRWHTMVDAQDFSHLADIVAAEAVFRSPVAYTPYPGQQKVVKFLQSALAMFDNFHYARTFVAGGNDVALEFSATVRGKDVKGVDLIRFGDDGQIEEFEVILRPASALAIVAEEMGARMGMQPKAAA
jgi:ketosteroid isomerase-like protein